MTHVTTFLIVLTLTGSPAAEAACISWCDAPSSTAGTLCRESVAEPMSLAMSDRSSTCAALLAPNPFLKEEGRIAFQTQTSLGVVNALDTPLMGGARLAYIRSGDCEAIDGRPTPTRVLRL